MMLSMLDTDLYKFTVSEAYFELFRNAQGTFTFKDRSNFNWIKHFIQKAGDETKGLKMLDDFKTKIEMAFQQIGNIALTDEEFNWLTHTPTLQYMSYVYFEWLKTFRFDPSKINFSFDKNGVIQIDVTDYMYKVTLYEIPILETISEIRNAELYNGCNLDKVREIIDTKIDYANAHNIKFSEFGTRRRFNSNVQEVIIQELKNKCPVNCLGTSNVYFAMKYNMKASGTFPHEWVMFHEGVYGFKRANYLAAKDWAKVYHGDLGIYLVDTLTTKSFLHTLTLDIAKLFDGFRQDSGDEREVGNMIVDKLVELGIDPTTKTIIFSNALTFKKAEQIQRYFKGIVKTGFGIGTYLTCDPGIDNFEAPNMVMKLSKCRFSSRDFWEPVIKISDDLGKHMGDPELFRIAAKELHFKELRIDFDHQTNHGTFQ